MDFVLEELIKGMKIEGKTALAMVLFVVSVFMVMSKFMLPTTFQVFIEGQSTFIREIPNVYTVLDCIIIAIFSFPETSKSSAAPEDDRAGLLKILQDLEDRSLIFRYDYGMSKMVKAV